MFDIGYDESCYIAWLDRFLQLNYPACPAKGYFPGVALLWYPLGKIGQWLSLLTGHEPHSWVIPLAAFTSFILWALSLSLVVKIFQHFPESERPLNAWGKGAPLLFVFSTPVLPFATLHGLHTHAAEFFLAAFTVLMLLENRCWSSLAGCTLLALTRANDLPVFALILGRLLDQPKEFLPKPKFQRYLFTGLLTFAAAGALFKVFKLIFMGGYSWLNGMEVLSHFRWFGIVTSLRRADFGLFWFAPAWLAILFCSLIRIKKVNWLSRSCLIWMAANFVYLTAHTGWMGFRTSVQLRYLVGCSLGALLVWVDLRRHSTPQFIKWMESLFFISIITVTLNTWSGGNSYQFEVTDSAYLFRRWVVEPIGASPLVFSFLSWLPPALLPNAVKRFESFLLHGPALWLMSLSSLITTIYLIRKTVSYFRTSLDSLPPLAPPHANG